MANEESRFDFKITEELNCDAVESLFPDQESRKRWLERLKDMLSLEVKHGE